MTKRDFLLTKARASVLKGRYDYEIPGGIDNIISNNNKTNSFMEYCYDNNIDVDEVLETIVFQENEKPSLTYNHYNDGDLLIWELTEEYSKQLFPKIGEPIYCKVGYDLRNVLKVVLHRSWSDM